MSDGRTAASRRWRGGARLNKLEAGPLHLDFSAPVMAAGTQIQAQFPGAFTASIEAFDGLGNSLGSWSANGLSTFDQDGSALFLGVSSPSAEISRVSVWLNSSADPAFLDFAINHVSLKTVSQVPEGLPVTAFGATLLGLFWARRKMA